MNNLAALDSNIFFFKILILDFKRIEQGICRVASLCLHDLNKLLKQIGLWFD